MKKFLILSSVFLLAFSSSFAADKVYPIGETLGIVADDQEWSCDVVSIEDSGLVGNDYGTLFVRGKAKSDPVAFDFFTTIQHRKKTWAETSSSQHMGEILKNYVNCTNTILSNWKIKECDHGKIVVEGDYLDASSTGYFQLSSEPLGLSDYKKIWFTMFVKIESEFMDKETQQFYYESAKSLKRRLY